MPNINTILDQHIISQCECIRKYIDRLYLNAHISILQLPGQLVSFLVKHRQQPIPSPALLGHLTRDLATAVERFAQKQSIPIVRFHKGQRKVKVARPYFKHDSDKGEVVKEE